MAHTAEEVQKQVRIYISVFVALMAFTVITVGVSYLHLAVIPAIILALTIATIKGLLVAGYFMHLLSEKKLIYWVLILTLLFFVVLLMIPSLTENEMIRKAFHVS
ncbi:MAG: cytochrome C oxidase subunit IV family protein [Deltaproteobacteria bacterium]|nr:cytochrome C oxidase subunit IV family protein [Deltaproteobacteria bacterium]